MSSSNGGIGTASSKRVKIGVLNLGQEFEKLVPAYFALKLLNNKKIESFRLTLNPSSFRKFDDLIIDIYYCDKNTEKLAFQLKHRQRDRDKLNAAEEFSGRKSDRHAKAFNISQYSDAFDKEYKQIKDTYKFVLYTNAKFQNIQNDAKYKTIDCEKSFKENSLNSGRILKLINSEIQDKKELSFYDKFFLFSEQKNIDELKNSIIDILAEEFDADVQMATYYIDFFGDVRSGKYDNIDVTKDNLIVKLTDLLISRHVVGNHLKNPQIQKAVKHFDISVVQRDLKKVELKDYLQEFEEEEMRRLEDLKVITKKVDLFTREIKKHFLTVSYLGKRPLVVRVSDASRQSVYKVIHLAKELKSLKITFVLIDEKFERDKFENWTILQYLVDLTLKQVTDVYKEIKKSYKVSLQGRNGLPVETFEKFGINLETLISLYDILQFEEVFEVGPTIDPLPQPFIERHLLIRKFSIKVLKTFCKNNTVFIFCKSSRYHSFKEQLKEELTLPVIDFQMYQSNTSAYKKDYVVLTDQQLKNPENYNYYLQLGDDNYLEFLISEKTAKESEIYYSKLNAVIGDPGTGKTTMMKYLETKCPLSYWIANLQTQELEKLDVKEITTELILELLTNQESNNPKMFDCFKGKENLIFMFDAVDELDRKKLNKIITVIKQMPKGYKIWIFCRENVRSILEKELAFDVVYSIKELGEDDQNVYIEKTLKETKSKKEIEKIVENVFKPNSKFINLDMLRKPLYLHIFTQILINSKILPSSMTLLELYSQFIEGKFNHYIQKTGVKDWANCTAIIDGFKKYRLREYKIAAVNVCLEGFNEKNDTAFVDEITESDVLGIVNVKDGKFAFVHHTVAEYFTALWLAENILNIDEHKRINIINRKYPDIKQLFDMKLSESKPLHSALLERNFAEAESRTRTNLNDLDCYGRNPAHLICSFGLNVNENVADLSNVIISEEQKKFGRFLQELIKLNVNIMAQDKIFQWNCFQYADACWSLHTLNILLENTEPQWSLFPNLQKLVDNKVEVKKPVLHFAIENNLKHLAKILIKHNFDLKIVDHQKSTSLHEAAYWGRTQIMNRLLEENVEIEAKNCRGRTALQLASKMGYQIIVELLVRKGADVNTRDIFERTPLEKASYMGHKDVVEFLINKGAKVNSKNLSGNTALHRAALMGHLPTVKSLVENGADLEARNKYSKTPLHVATHAGREDIVKYLIEKGSNTSAKDELQRNPLEIAEEKEHQHIIKILHKAGQNGLRTKSWSDQTSKTIHQAAEDNDIEKVEGFLSKGHDINAIDEKKRTPLLIASYRGHEKLVGFLLEHKADPNLQNCDERGPLHVAAQRGHAAIIKRLLFFEAEKHTVDSFKQTALHRASYSGNLDAVKLLIKKGLDIEAVDKFGTTPLHLAVCGGNRDIIQYLAVQGADFTKTNKNEETCLILATQLESRKGVEYILEHKSDLVDRTDIRGRTALHWAAELGYKKILELLVENHADLWIRDARKETALDVAESFKRKDIVEYLKPRYHKK